MTLFTTIFHNIHQWLKQKKIALSISLMNAIIISLLSYWWNNMPILTGEKLVLFGGAEFVKDRFGINHQAPDSNVLFVNIAYDRTLVEKKNQYDLTVGNTDITDRAKLLQFLQILDSVDTYSYIFLDVRFEKGLKAPLYDSLLFSQISKMQRIVISNHEGMQLADTILSQKAAFNDYKSTIAVTGFTRYQYTYNNDPSMALYAYQELKGKTIIDYCDLFYTSDKKLCYNSMFILFPIEYLDEYFAPKEYNGIVNHSEPIKKVYYNLGSDILNPSNLPDVITDTAFIADIATLTKDKYIVIGNMVEDTHDTYSGKRPGPVITYNAFKTLMDQKHIVNLWLMLLMAVVYFSISLSQFSHKAPYLRVSFIAKSKSKFLHFTLSLIKYTFFLTIIVFILNLFWDISVSVIIPSLYFTIQKSIINYKRMKL